jgi:hypothetical protein
MHVDRKQTFGRHAKQVQPFGNTIHKSQLLSHTLRRYACARAERNQWFQEQRQFETDAIGPQQADIMSRINWLSYHKASASIS